MMDQNSGPFSVMSEEEAKEIHSLFVMGFIAFTLIALVAHLFVWAWRPWGWLPYASLDESVSVAMTNLTSLIS